MLSWLDVESDNALGQPQQSEAQRDRMPVHSQFSSYPADTNYGARLGIVEQKDGVQNQAGSVSREPHH
jgi:hypothetical protein